MLVARSVRESVFQCEPEVHSVCKRLPNELSEIKWRRGIFAATYETFSKFSAPIDGFLVSCFIFTHNPYSVNICCLLVWNAVGMFVQPAAAI